MNKQYKPGAATYDNLQTLCNGLMPLQSPLGTAWHMQLPTQFLLACPQSLHISLSSNTYHVLRLTVCALGKLDQKSHDTWPCLCQCVLTMRKPSKQRSKALAKTLQNLMPLHQPCIRNATSHWSRVAFWTVVESKRSMGKRLPDRWRDTLWHTSTAHR